MISKYPWRAIPWTNLIANHHKRIHLTNHLHVRYEGWLRIIRETDLNKPGRLTWTSLNPFRHSFYICECGRGLECESHHDPMHTGREQKTQHIYVRQGHHTHGCRRIQSVCWDYASWGQVRIPGINQYSHPAMCMWAHIQANHRNRLSWLVSIAQWASRAAGIASIHGQWKDNNLRRRWKVFGGISNHCHSISS